MSAQHPPTTYSYKRPSSVYIEDTYPTISCAPHWNAMVHALLTCRISKGRFAPMMARGCPCPLLLLLSLAPSCV